MATLDCRIEDDSKFFKVLYPKAHPNISQEITKVVYEDMMLTGEIQIETLLENAIEGVGGPRKNSRVGMDFEDRSDAKKSCVRTRAHGKEYSGPVTSIASKVGALRVMMYERKQDNFYYFIIPWKAYFDKTWIEIPFDLSGVPKRKNHWWNHEVKTFEEMATTRSE